MLAAQAALQAALSLEVSVRARYGVVKRAAPARAHPAEQPGVCGQHPVR